VPVLPPAESRPPDMSGYVLAAPFSPSKFPFQSRVEIWTPKHNRPIPWAHPSQHVG